MSGAIRDCTLGKGMVLINDKTMRMVQPKNELRKVHEEVM